MLNLVVMNRYISWGTVVFFMFILARMEAQTVESPDLPNVFVIGDHVQEYERLYLKNINLLEVCKDDMKLAFENWMHMVEKMDDLSQELGVDLKGIKLWLNVFWDAEGNIKHLAYYPKPTSKNIEYNLLTAFFKNFVNSYQLPLKASQDFSHYGSAAFPTLSDRLASKSQKN